jgi:hypothetical protein
MFSKGGKEEKGIELTQGGSRKAGGLQMERCEKIKSS